MPVYRYRSVEQMPPVPPCRPGSPEHLRRWAALWERTTRLAHGRKIAGVTRYRSVEEAWATATGQRREPA